jgi:hypothetical protein
MVLVVGNFNNFINDYFERCKMKTLILCLCLMFLAGCSGIIINKFDDTGRLKERVIISSSMVKMDFDRLSVHTADVNVVIDKYVQDYNSQSWIDIGRGVAAGMSGGASEVAEKAVENLTE